MSVWERPTYGLIVYDTVQYNTCAFNFPIGIVLIVYKVRYYYIWQYYA
jgi:hypothetical protein